MKETMEEFMNRINRYNRLHSLENIDFGAEDFQPWTVGIGTPNYKDYCNAYVKALFFGNKKWIKYLEKNRIESDDQLKFKRLVGKTTLPARKNYFETRESKLNSYLRYFIDKNDRYKTNEELYVTDGKNK